MFKSLRKSTRRPGGYLLALLLSGVPVCVDVEAQTPVVVSSSAVTVPHNEVLGTPWQNTVSNRGDFVVLDFKTGGIYQYPVGNGAEITIGAPNAIAGGFQDSGIVIDPRNNNLYLDNNYNGGLIELPYNPATGKWDLPLVVVAKSLAGNLGGSCGNYFQSTGLAMNSKGVIAVATENGCGVGIFTVTIDATGAFGPAIPIISKMLKRAKTVAIDDAGNIYYTEDSGGAPGVQYIPAGVTGLSGETTVTRVDPASLSNVQGVSVDPVGNVYVADGTAGVYLIPLVAGIPTTSRAVLLTAASAQSNASLDPARGILFVPVSGFGSFIDMVKIYLNRAELGSTVVGATGVPATTITYNFSGAATPASFAIQEAGTSGDFAIATGGTCAVGTAYAASGNCTVNVTLTPQSVGDVSATLVMLDAKGASLASTTLHGVGLGASVIVAPGTESVIGSAFKTPTQVAVDVAGNVYVADSGLGKVLQYAKGSGAGAIPVVIGTGLTAPTGVAVDGTGNVYVADSGKVIEIPYSQTGLNSGGQFVLKSGLGMNVQLAADGIGNLFVADISNLRVSNLNGLVVGTAQSDLNGFTQLTAIATDGIGTLYIANGQNLIQVSALGVQSTLLNTLSNTTGLAVDASGAVYVTSSTQTLRIPNEAGNLNVAHQIVLTSGVTTPASVALDSVGSVYVLDAKALNVDYINDNGSVNLGTLATTSATATANATLVNDGNTQLKVTGYGKSADFSVTSDTCVGAVVAVGASCNATVTFNAGAGDQGKLTALLLIQGNASNAPIGINAVGTAAALAASVATVTVTKPTVTNAPVVVTVASVAGTGITPTGNVTVTVTGTGFKTLVTTSPLVNGTVTLNETALPVGIFNVVVKYGGDRVYGTSTATATATVTAGGVALVQPAASSVPIYVLASGLGSQEPYDGSEIPFYYNYIVTVKAANGSPLLGTPIINSGGVQTGTDFGRVTYQVAGGTPACNGTAAIVNVADDGTAPFGTRCFSIDTSNNQIPNLMTTYTFTPVYSGNTDPNYGTVTGTPVTLIALRNPMVLISSNPGSLSVASGSSATSNLTLTSLLGYGVAGAAGNLNNYSLPLEMTCDGLPAHASCSFSYPTPDPSDKSSVAVTPTTAGQVVMTVNTNVSVGTTTASIAHPITDVFAVMFGFGVLGISLRRKKALRGYLLTGVALLVCSGAMVGLTACSTTNIGATPILTTPKGTYAVTVTAKQVGSRTVVVGGVSRLVYGNGNQMSVPYSINVTIQ